MKHQQVTVDFANMVFTACSYLALAGAVWVFLRLIQACFWLPRHLKKQNNVQKMLQEKVESYEKYILECEEKEKAMLADKGDDGETCDEESIVNTEKWKERRECLEMLKKELSKVHETKDEYNWDYLLEEEEKRLEGIAVDPVEDNDNLMDECNKTEYERAKNTGKLAKAERKKNK